MSIDLTEAKQEVYEAMLSGGHDGLTCAPNESLGETVERAIRAALIAVADDLRAEGARQALRDEYHTMDELYEYRMLYNALAANAMPDKAVKSWRHSDGEECFGGGWFVAYLMLPSGQVSNHYKAEHWDLFQIPEVEVAPEWDGHTPQVAAQRLYEAVRADQIEHAARCPHAKCPGGSICCCTDQYGRTDQ